MSRCVARPAEISSAIGTPGFVGFTGIVGEPEMIVLPRGHQFVESA